MFKKWDCNNCKTSKSSSKGRIGKDGPPGIPGDRFGGKTIEIGPSTNLRCFDKITTDGIIGTWGNFGFTSGNSRPQNDLYRAYIQPNFDLYKDLNENNHKTWNHLAFVPGQEILISKTASPYCSIEVKVIKFSSELDISNNEYYYTLDFKIIPETNQDTDCVNAEWNQTTESLISLSGAVGVKGDQGEKGDTGPKGIQGPQGPQGYIGLTGNTGPIGYRGFRGFQGPQGPQGPQGLQGDDGPRGHQGVRGFQGPQGPQGPQGLQGDDGPIGNQGLRGFQGPQGPQGQQGPQGDIGGTGEKGSDGLSLIGPQGPQGDRGPKGNDGSTIGGTGPPGPRGPQGPQGDPGETGDKGEVGEYGLVEFKYPNNIISPSPNKVRTTSASDIISWINSERTGYYYTLFQEDTTNTSGKIIYRDNNIAVRTQYRTPFTDIQIKIIKTPGEAGDADFTIVARQEIKYYPYLGSLDIDNTTKLDITDSLHPGLHHLIESKDVSANTTYPDDVYGDGIYFDVHLNQSLSERFPNSTNYITIMSTNYNFPLYKIHLNNSNKHAVMNFESTLSSSDTWSKMIYSLLLEKFINSNNVSITEASVANHPPLTDDADPDNPTYGSLAYAVQEWFAGGDRKTTIEAVYGKINYWNTSQVTNMYALFRGESFNLDISCWDTSNVTNMSAMFDGATSFNQDISSWDVGRVTNFSSMFINATSFNQDISNWNVISSENFSAMFEDATNFDQNLSNWSWSYPAPAHRMFKGAFNTQTNADWTISGSSTNFRTSLNAINTTPRAANPGTATAFFHDGADYKWTSSSATSSATDKYPVINDASTSNPATAFSTVPASAGFF